MDRVSGLDPLLIRQLADTAGELPPVPSIELGKRPGDRADISLSGRIPLLEQPAPHDLKRLLMRRGAPLVSHPADHLLQPGQGLTAVQPANLQIRAAAFLLLGR